MKKPRTKKSMVGGNIRYWKTQLHAMAFCFAVAISISISSAVAGCTTAPPGASVPIIDDGMSLALLLSDGSGSQEITSGSRLTLGPAGLGRIAFTGDEKVTGILILPEGTALPAAFDASSPESYPALKILASLGGNLQHAFTNAESISRHGAVHHVYIAFKTFTTTTTTTVTTADTGTFFFELLYDSASPDLSSLCRTLFPRVEDIYRFIEKDDEMKEFSWLPFTLEKDSPDILSPGILSGKARFSEPEDLIDLPAADPSGRITVSLGEGSYHLVYTASDPYENISSCRSPLVVTKSVLSYKTHAKMSALPLPLREGDRVILSADPEDHPTNVFKTLGGAEVTHYRLALLAGVSSDPSDTEAPAPHIPGDLDALTHAMVAYTNDLFAVTLKLMLADVPILLNFEVLRDTHKPSFSSCDDADPKRNFFAKLTQGETTTTVSWTLPQLDDQPPTGTGTGTNGERTPVTLSTTMLDSNNGMPTAYPPLSDSSRTSQTLAEGTYQLVYSATDSAGNVAVPCVLTLYIYNTQTFLLYRNKPISDKASILLSEDDGRATTMLTRIFTEAPDVITTAFLVTPTPQTGSISYVTGSLADAFSHITDKQITADDEVVYVYLKFDDAPIKTLAFTLVIDTQAPVLSACSDLSGTIASGLRELIVPWTLPTLLDTPPKGWQSVGRPYPQGKIIAQTLYRKEGSGLGEKIAELEPQITNWTFVEQETYTLVTQATDFVGKQTSCERSITITDDNYISFAFPSPAKTIEAQRNGMDVNKDNPFSCKEPNWAGGNTVCLEGPYVDFTSEGEANTVSLYEKVEIEIIHGRAHIPQRNKFHDVDVLVSLIATEQPQPPDVASPQIRALTRADVSVELLRYVTHYGSDPMSTPTERTLREDITHLWPYLQGRKLTLTMNNGFGYTLEIDAVRFILTPYPSPPQRDTLLPYRVIASLGSGRTPKTPPLTLRYYQHKDFFGPNSEMGLLANSKLRFPEATLKANDISKLAQVRAYIYDTGHFKFEFKQYKKTVWFATARTLLPGEALEMGTLNIHSGLHSPSTKIDGHIQPDDPTSPYHRRLPYNPTSIYASTITERTYRVRAGWLPGKRIPYYPLTQTHNNIARAHDKGSLKFTAGQKVYLNLKFPKDQRPSQGGPIPSECRTSVKCAHWISGVMVFYAKYVPPSP